MPLINGHCTGVYLIRSLRDEKVYVGGAYKSFNQRRRIHWRDLSAGRHGNQHLQSAWNKYGRSNFKFEVVEICPPKELASRETYWIAQYDATNRKSGYNKSPTGGSPLGVKHPPEYGEAVRLRNLSMSEETKRKIGEKSRGRIQPAESRKRQADALRGKKRPPEVVKKIAEILRGKKRSPEARARIAAANRARENTPDLREKLGRANRGRKWSAEVVEKRAAPLRGRKRPREVVEKISAKNRGKKRSSEAVARITAAIRARVITDELREKLGRSHRGKQSAELIAKRVAGMKRYWESKHAKINEAEVPENS